MAKLKLISFELCPFVQRAVIVLNEKKIDFEVEFIDLQNKPKWFLEISPLGKVPVLMINDEVIFESAVIIELLDEIYQPTLHPEDVYLKAKHRSWMEFASVLTVSFSQLINAPDSDIFQMRLDDVNAKFAILNEQIQLPFFGGDCFRLVDVAYAPLFMRIQKIEEIFPLKMLENFEKAQKYSENLLLHPAVLKSEIENYSEKLINYLKN
jgi:glutathione S-transferase